MTVPHTFTLTDKGHVHEGKNALNWFATSFYNDALDEHCLEVALKLRDADRAVGFMPYLDGLR